MVTSDQPDALEGAREHDPRPIVALPRPGVPAAVIAGIAALLALALFLVLDSQRRHAAVVSHLETTRGSAFVAPPALAIPPEPEPALQPVPPAIVTSPLPQLPGPRPRASVPLPPVTAPIIVPLAPALSTAVPKPEQPAPRLNAPALIFDSGAGDAGTLPAGAAAPGQGGAGGQGRSASSTGDDAPARATIIRNRATVMPTGTLIPAVLETPIDTARPGLVRAVVSRDARGFDGSRVLVPRGSRLIGEYQSDVRPGQNRVLVTWTRLIRPDGVAIRLGSPAADPLGGAGIRGRVNSFFFERFAAAVLQSALTIGVNIASRPGDGSVIVGVPTGQVGNTIGQGLLPGNDLRPKITVKQGAALNVFVARDLDFSGTGKAP